jgi:hypothetical protein
MGRHFPNGGAMHGSYHGFPGCSQVFVEHGEALKTDDQAHSGDMVQTDENRLSILQPNL